MLVENVSGESQLRTWTFGLGVRYFAHDSRDTSQLAVSPRGFGP